MRKIQGCKNQNWMGKLENKITFQKCWWVAWWLFIHVGFQSLYFSDPVYIYTMYNCIIEIHFTVLFIYILSLYSIYPMYIPKYSCVQVVVHLYHTTTHKFTLSCIIEMFYLFNLLELFYLYIQVVTDRAVQTIPSIPRQYGGQRAPVLFYRRPGDRTSQTVWIYTNYVEFRCMCKVCKTIY